MVTDTAPAARVAAFLASRITGQVTAQDGGVAVTPDAGQRDHALAVLSAFGFTPARVGDVLVVPAAQLA